MRTFVATNLLWCVTSWGSLPLLPGDSNVSKGSSGNCYLPSDIMILQDTTGSFMDDMPIIHDQIPQLIAKVASEFPGTRFGIAEFRDKPYFPLGETTDFCSKVRFGELTSDATRLQFAWDILQPSGGGDFYEAQFQAGINIAFDTTIGWRPFAEGAYNVTTRVADSEALATAVAEWEEGDTTFVGAHIIVLITDAEPHIPGDLAMCAPGAPGWEPSWNCPQNLPPNPGYVVDGDVDKTCKNYDYPEPEQFKLALQKENIMVIFLTTDDVTNYWSAFSESSLGQPSSFSQIISSNSDNLTNALIEALRGVAEVACPASPTSSSTTKVPTTPTTTTMKSGIVTVTPGGPPVGPPDCVCPCPPQGSCNPCEACYDLVFKIGPQVQELHFDLQG